MTSVFSILADAVLGLGFFGVIVFFPPVIFLLETRRNLTRGVAWGAKWHNIDLRDRLSTFDKHWGDFCKKVECVLSLSVFSMILGVFSTVFSV